MNLNKFIEERTVQKARKYKTVNLDDELHLFFKQTANHYNIALADLMYNILSHWREEYQEEIKKDILRNLGT